MFDTIKNLFNLHPFETLEDKAKYYQNESAYSYKCAQDFINHKLQPWGKEQAIKCQANSAFESDMARGYLFVLLGVEND